MKRLVFHLLILISAFFAFSNTAMAQQTPPPNPPAEGGGMWDWLPGGDDDEDKRKSLESWQQTFSMPSACWGCELFSTMARVTLGFGEIGEELFAGPAIGAMNAFMGLWVVWQLYMLLSPSNANGAAQTIDTIFQRLVLMMVILWILRQGSFSYIMEGFVFPMIGGIMQSAVQLIPGGGAGGCSGGGGGGSEAAASLIQAGNGLMCAMHVEMGRGMGMGAFLMDDADFSMIPPRIELFQMLGGMIMFLAFLTMLIMLPFRLFDALIRLTVVSVVLPLVVFAYQFKPTRGAVKQAATSVLAAGLTFFFTALAVAVSVTLLNEVTSPVLNAITSGSDADGFVGPLDGNQFMILIASAIGMAAFIKQAGTIAAEFAGFQGSMGNVGGAGGAAVGGAMVAGGGAIGLVGGRMGAKAGQAAGGAMKSLGGKNSGSGSAASGAGKAEMTR